MSRKVRKILLLNDDYLVHDINETITYAKVVFLLPNSTVVLRPLDLGNIRSFKCETRKLQARHVMHWSGNNNATPLDAYERVSIRDAILHSWRTLKEIDVTTTKAFFNASFIFINIVIEEY